MAKVYAFPEKKRLPKGVEKGIHRIAKEYVEALCATAMLFGVEDNFDEGFDEVYNLVNETFVVGLINAMNELEES